jgi:hypothetical protein
MTPHAAQQLLREADYIDRYTRYYRRQFAAAVQRSSVQADPASLQCVRMCLEALDMIADSRQTMVAALSKCRH